jgi:hypothetical protein
MADSEQVITQCVRNTPFVGDFNFGASFRIDSTGAAVSNPICQAMFYSGFNCDADIVLTVETGQPTQGGAWGSVSSVLHGVTGANSVAFNCYLFPSEGVTYYFDMFYLSKAPGSF